MGGWRLRRPHPSGSAVRLAAKRRQGTAFSALGAGSISADLASLKGAGSQKG